MNYNKKIIRNIYMYYRNNLSINEILKLSNTIFFKLKKLLIWKKTYYHIYLTSKELNEVNTLPIINYLFKKKKNSCSYIKLF